MAGTIVANTINTDAGLFSTQNAYSGIAKAWVNFAGATGTINGSFNVSSITRNTTGYYTINLTTAMSNTNYVIVGSTSGTGSNPSGGLQINSQSFGGSWAGVTPTTTTFGVGVLSYNGASAIDPTYVSVCVLGA